MTVDPADVERMVELSATNAASEVARAWLDAPRPPPGATGPYAMQWYAHWMRILLLDLAVFDPIVITHQGAAEIIGIPDVALVQVILDQLRRDDEERPPLTAADFARVKPAH